MTETTSSRFGTDTYLGVKAFLKKNDILSTPKLDEMIEESKVVTDEALAKRETLNQDIIKSEYESQKGNALKAPTKKKSTNVSKTTSATPDPKAAPAAIVKPATQPRESTEAIDKALSDAIDNYITARLAQSDTAMITSDPNEANTINFKKSPFGGVIVSLDGSVKPGDMQMRTKEPWRAYEHVFEGTNLTNWRKLPFQDRDRIINKADKKWNEVTAIRENAINARNNPTNTVTTAKLPEKKKENTEVAQQAIVTEVTALMNRMIDNSAKFSSEFMENKGEGSKRIILNPFSEVQWPSQGGVVATDLQMKNNQIFTAYEEILNGTNLAEWRKLNGDERSNIINRLNTTWNTAATAKLTQIQKGKK